MDRTRWIIFAAICFATIGGLVFLSTKDRVDVSKIDASKVITTETLKNAGVTTEGAIADNVSDNVTSKVVLVEYGDYQCPGCHSAFGPLQQVKANYKDSIAFVFRNFPLTDIHPNAYAAATTAEAAGRQGKYWEMHDLLYANYDEWTAANTQERDGIFRRYAEELKLNIDQFTNDLTSKAISEKINRDRSLGAKQRVDATPTFLINGKKISEDAAKKILGGDVSGLTASLDTVIKETGGTPPAKKTE